MNRSLIAAVGAALILAPASAAFAHHSTVQYDMTKSVEVKGVVKEFEPQNPHMVLRLMITDAKGVHELSLEGQSVNNMYRLGFRRDMIKVGDAITVDYAPMRTGEEGGFFTRVVTAGGKAVGMQPAGVPPSPKPAEK